METALYVATTVSSFCLVVSPGLDIYHIHKAKCTGDTSVLPIVSIFGNCYLWGIYGCQTGEWFPLVAISIYGVTAAVIFVAVYYRYSIERGYIRKLCGSVLLGVGIVTVYVVVARSGVTNQNKDQIIDITGYIAMAVNIALYASPLETVKYVVQTKSAVSMPAAFCVVALVNSVFWVGTAIIDNNMYILIPNVIGVALALVQVMLCWVYRPSRTRMAVSEAQDEGSIIKSASSLQIEPMQASPIAYEAVHSPSVLQQA